MPHQALALERAGQLEVRFDMLSISEIVRQRYEKIVHVGSEDFGFDFIHFDISSAVVFIGRQRIITSLSFGFERVEFIRFLFIYFILFFYKVRNCVFLANLSAIMFASVS